MIRVTDNGVYEIEIDNFIIKQAYPALNGEAIKPLSVEVKRSDKHFMIKYKLLEGDMRIGIEDTDKGINVKLTISNWKGQKETISIFHDAIIVGTKEITKQGLGFFGPSGKTKPESKIQESHGYIFLETEDHALCIFGEKVDQYHQYYDYHMEHKKEKQELQLSCYIEVEEELSEIDERSFITYFEVISNSFEAKRVWASEFMTLQKKRSMSKFISQTIRYWCSWYDEYHYFDDDDLIDTLEAYKDETLFDYFVIDASYMPALGDWLKQRQNWKRSLIQSVELIKSYGYQPGLWIAPYLVGERSDLFKEHPNWLLLNHDGKALEIRNYNMENRFMGFKDRKYYVLDITVPEAKEYILEVFKSFIKMGIKLLKVDFLFWGLQNTREANYRYSNQSSVEIYSSFIQDIRNIVGNEIYLLGCIGPFLPSLGVFDGMRIAGDTVPYWIENDISPQNMIQEAIADCFFNGVFWNNDTDAMFFRSYHNDLKKEEKISLALLQTFTSSIYAISDRMDKMTDEDKWLLKSMWPKSEKNFEILEIDYSKEHIFIEARKLKSETLLVFIMNRDVKRHVFTGKIKSQGINVNSRLYEISPCFNKRQWTINLSSHWFNGEEVAVTLEGHQSFLGCFLREEPERMSAYEYNELI